MNYNQKRKVLYASTRKGLIRQMKHLANFSYVQASDIKCYEHDKYPYQVLVVKKWLIKESKNEFNKVI